MAELPTIDSQNRYGALMRQPQNTNAALRTKFKFELRRIPHISYLCQSVNIPGLQISAIDQPTMFNNIKHPGGKVITDYFVVTFAIDENWKNWKEIHDWIQSCSTYSDFDQILSESESLTSEAILFILINENVPQIKVTFDGMFPIKLSTVKLDTRTQVAEPLYAEVTFAYTTFKFEYFGSGDVIT